MLSYSPPLFLSAPNPYYPLYVGFLVLFQARGTKRRGRGHLTPFFSKQAHRQTTYCRRALPYYKRAVYDILPGANDRE